MKLRGTQSNRRCLALAYRRARTSILVTCSQRARKELYISKMSPRSAFLQPLSFTPTAFHQHPIPYLSPTANARHSSQSSRRSAAAETTLGSARHKPSLSGPSLGHLLSELSPTTPEMLAAGLRQEGQTMNEEHRTLARKVTIGIVGLPLAFGSLVVGGTWLWGKDEEIRVV